MNKKKLQFILEIHKYKINFGKEKTPESTGVFSGKKFKKDRTEKVSRFFTWNNDTTTNNNIRHCIIIPFFFAHNFNNLY